MKCFFDVKIRGVVLFFIRTTKLVSINLDEIKAAMGLHMVIDTIHLEDIPFVEELMKICNDQDYFNFAVTSKNLDDSVINELQILQAKLFKRRFTKLVFSLSLAVNHPLSDQVYVGTYAKCGELEFVQPFNGGTLTYEKFKEVLPCAKKLAETIETENLDSTLEKIIWIDSWFQENIQYIKDRETPGPSGEKYICDNINAAAIVPDVFKNHYGTCEDISASIAILLDYLKIPYETVQVDYHAWLLVAIEKCYYIWDCTHNITRNPHKATNGLKATEYSHAFTLVGTDSYPTKYASFGILPNVSQHRYPINLLEAAKKRLIIKTVPFIYSNMAKYNSVVITTQKA